MGTQLAIEKDEVITFENWPGRFFVTVTAERFDNFHNVNFALFRPDMSREEATRALYTAGYSGELDSCLFPYPAETFNADQVDKLNDYFSQFTDMKVKVEPAAWPWPHLSGISVLPYGGYTGLCRFSQSDDWPLTIKVHGYYDLRLHGAYPTSLMTLCTPNPAGWSIATRRKMDWRINEGNSRGSQSQ